MLSSPPNPGVPLIALSEPEQVGKYKLVAKIGQGAMGSVYKAHDPVLNRFVAIKTIRSAGSSDDLDKRFLREAQSAARLNHPNIVTILDFGEDQNRLYMAMELLLGKDLKEVIKHRTLPNLDEKLRVMAEICDGLAFAHGMEVVHRDLKPANIHVLPNGQVKIMDFGLARLGASDMTKSGMILGTPNYMSPEQVRGEKADTRSDIFSVGAVFYELLVGRKAFEAESMHSVLLQVLQEEPQPLPEVMPDLPDPIAEIVEKALNKDPQQRYAHAGEMFEAVRDLREQLAAESPELMGLAPGAESTLHGDEAPTMMELNPTVAARGASLAGATALAPRSAVRPKAAPRQPATLSGKAKTHPPRREPPVAPPPSRTPLLIGGALVVAVALGAVGYRLLRNPTAPGPSLAPADLAKEQEGILKEALVDSQLELAQLDFDNKDYQGAIDQAQKVLAIDPNSSRATQLRDRSHAVLAELEATAALARSAFAKGDTDAASRALTKVLSIDPRHPVAAELTAQLNRFFRSQAESARQDARDSKAGADKGRGASQPDYAMAEGIVREADTLFDRGEFAVATQKFMEGRDAYEKARRTAEATAKPPAPRPSVATADPVVAAQQRPALPPPSLGAPPLVTQPPVSAPPPTAAAAPPTAPAPPTLSAAADAAVRHVLADYERAIETRDLELFRRVKPNLSKEDEKRLTDAFKAIKSQEVGLTVDSVVVDGAEAIVKVSRQDTINGNKMKAVQQTFRLVRAGEGWAIQSIGQ